MAIASVLDIAQLDEGWVLAPERYDPRRRGTGNDGPRLGDFVRVLREQINVSSFSTGARGTRSLHEKASASGQFLVLDTGDAHNGIIRPSKGLCDGRALRSTKKRIRPRQVIISRLRPYLRQVAWVDSGLLEGQADVELLCSTEFFVLDAADEESIAFLVPFLLSTPVQSILAAAQEGGHHPRFNERTLTTLPIPASIIEDRAALSRRVEWAVGQARQAYRTIRDCVDSVKR